MLHNQVAMLSGRPAGGKSPSDEGEDPRPTLPGPTW